MGSLFTEEQVRLAIGNAVINNSQLTDIQLIEELFGPNKSSLPSVLKEFIREEFFRQCKRLCRFAAKNWIVNRLKTGSSDFIKQFVAAQNAKRLVQQFPADLQARLIILEKEDALGSLLIEFSRLFNKLREKFVPAQSEDRFRDFLARWLQSGYMALNIRKTLDQWKQNGPSLKNLKSIKWPSGTENNVNWREFQNRLKNIKTDNFVETEKLQTILNLLLAKPKLSVNNLTIKLVGRMIFLSEWLKTIQDSIRANNVRQVEIFAEDSIGVDCDLTDEIWRGKNLVMVSNVIYIWQNSKICLSGKGFEPRKSKAANATSTQSCGTDGKNGQPGESSGNISILATKMFNPDKLTVELNGGRGEDGQDGGDGCDGKNGLGVTTSDFDSLVKSYNSLYFDSWSYFEKYSPPSNWTRQTNYSSSGEYIYRTYKDERGRTMMYSYAADKGWVYTTYELHVLVCGSNATSGTSGGSNGIGGQGGYHGTSTIQNPETGEQFQVNIIRNGKSSGPNGDNGAVGKSGKHGINGNDMALIDRSAKEASKHYEGSNDKKLSRSYIYTAECKSRLDGYRRYYSKENACFIKFGIGDPIDTSERRANKAQARTVRTAASEAVAKQSIVISKVLAESKAMFGKENAFLTDACKTTAQAAMDDEDVEEEEEATENVNEEVVILRQREKINKLAKYTPDGEKKERPIHTPETYVNHLKLITHKTTINTSAQILFDLFTIEFSPRLLDTISFHTIFHQTKYRQTMKYALALVLVAALQAKIVHGKSYDEIKTFNDQLLARRRRKLQTTRLRQKLENLSLEMDTINVKPSMDIVLGADEQFGVVDAELSSRLIPYNDQTNVKGLVKSFFSQYIFNVVDLKLLMVFNEFLKNIKPFYHQQLALFAQNERFQWTDKDTVQNYFQILKAWLVEESLFKEKNKKKKKKKKDDDGNDDDDRIEVEEKLPDKTMRNKTKLEQDFETFLRAVVADLTYWNQIIKPINEFIHNNSEYKARIGTPPSFDKGSILDTAKAIVKSDSSNDEKSIEQAQHVIKIYFLAKIILKYNQHLYIYNAMMLKEQGKFQDDIYGLDLNDPASFLSQCTRNSVPSDSDQCELYMIKYGLACAPFRYLLSLSLNIKLCSYRKVSFQTLRNVETLNPVATECEILWLHDDKQPVGIAPDREFRKLVAAQKAIAAKYNNDLSNEIETCINLDYNQKENLLAFASYFPQPLQNAVIEWLENYIAISQDQLLIRLLHNRLWIDGCHFSVFELQFLLVSCASLKTLYHCDLNYLLLVVSSVPQLQLVDVFLYLRTEYHYQSRFRPSSRVFTGIQLIPNSRYKALLAVKIGEHGLPIDESDLYKVILMLQHASNGSEQLVKIGLNEWISIAQKQKWSEIGYLLKQYGSIGYYLGVLDNKGFKEEERRMREIISEATIIPEKIIALYTQWIVTGEVTGNAKFFDALRKYFIQANNYPELQDKITKHQLLTTEVEQAKLINWMTTHKITENHVNYQNFTSANDRSVDELGEKIIRLHDSPEDKDKRRANIRRIAKILKSNDSKNSKNIYWLNQFDEALFKIKKKRLRDTQKMAVLCAVESKQHVLEQVNTGEGKSLIIAAIATIHRKTGKRYVDIITSSPVLAKRDADEMAILYGELGLNVADNCSEDLEERKKAYTADIVYGDIARFQRDYLLHTFYKKPIKGDRTQAAVIVDEVDNMLLDNGNNMLYLSHSVPGMDLLDSLLIFIQQQIHSPMYAGDKNDLQEMQKQFDNVTIKQRILADVFGRFSLEDLTRVAISGCTPTQIQAIFDKLIQGNIIDADGYLKIYRHDQQNLVKEALNNVDGALIIRIQACLDVIFSRERSIELPPYLRNFAKLHLDELIENCKHALFLEPNTGYVVDVDHTGKLTTALEPVVTIIDSNTGADLPTSQWCGGLHQFLQLKHGCRLSPMSLKAVFVSNVAYLKGYELINGLSGTLGSTEESKTLIELYEADLIKIPTNKPKIFYEHVPMIATVKQEWIQNIYSEICDQVRGTRSVLLICEDIKQLEFVLNGLNTCFANDTNRTIYTTECFTTITVYKREHDEFNFESPNEFKPHRLIIATNLAGRGTDIKLSQSLIDAGGLHVITTFMPKNCRIEEQAFGRAARCGQPGSAQIIAFADKEEDTIEPSVFQLKMFRDNAEVHRLQSLKSFYDFHTEIEELCLKKFRSYCDRALSAIYSTSSGGNDETLPTPSQVVYFALLDKWALWLDGKAPLIDQCAKELNKDVKETLINSVDEFLKNHPFGDASNCFEVAKTWIDAPQSLLTIGIIQMHHKYGFQDAEDTFNKIIADGHEFAAEAHYYRACMRIKNFDGTRQQVKSLTLRTGKEFPTNIDEAIEHFYKARSLFLRRLQRKQLEASIVIQMVEKASENNPKTSGFASQLASIATYTQLILTNIDFLLGSPCKSEMFAQDGITEAYSKEIYDSFYRQGLISPTLIARGKIEPWQIEPLRQKYKLNKAQIETLINSMSNDVGACSFDENIVLDRSLIFEKCQLSTKGEFWAEMEQQKALIDTEFYIVIHDGSLISKDVLDKFNQLKPFSHNDDPGIAKTLVRYSTGKDKVLMYKLADVNKLAGNDPKFSKEVDDLLEKGTLKLDKMAIALIIPSEMSYFSSFDGLTTDDLKEFFHLSNHGAGWIVNTLQERGIFQHQSVSMTRFTLNEDLWKKIVRVHLEPEAKKPENAPIELELIFEHAANLQKIKNNPKILNVTEDLIDVYCRISNDNDKNTKLKQFYDYLIKQKVLEPYIYNIWRLNSKLDCSSLPSCIADHIDEFLSDRFAYSFALENLCHSLERANSDPELTINQIFLPENPFATIFEDLVDCGLAMPPRICSSLNEIDDFDYEDFKHEEAIKSIAHTNRLKLFDQTDYHMDVIPFSTYVLDQGFTIDSDLRNIINNGLKVVVTRKKEKAGWWLLNTVVSAAVWCWTKIKSAANAIGSFCYSVVQFCLHLPGKIFNAVSSYLAPYVKEVGKFITVIAKPLMETKFGKAMAKAANITASVVTEAGYKTLEAAEWVIEKGSIVVNYVSKKATEGVQWLANTRFAQGAIGLAKDAGAWIASTEVWKAAATAATYIFTKMTNFCTAVSESYQYYNQCRAASRRLALEKSGLVDEHFILDTYRGISQQEAKKNEDEKIADDMLRKSIESWRVPLVNSLESTFTKKLNALSNDKYTVDFLKSTLQTSLAFKNLEIEISDLLNFFAWKVQIIYFKEIQTAFQKNTPLTNLIYRPAENLPTDIQFFVEDAFDEIIEELQKRTDDQGYESDTSDKSDIIDRILNNSVKYKSWKDGFKTVLDKLVQNAVDSVFIERTVSVILDYIASVQDTNLPPSQAETEFKNEDKNLKEALTEYNSNNQSKRKTQFLTAELHSIIQQVINSDHLNKSTIKTAIKYGYPLPLSATKTIAAAIDNYLTKQGFYKSGVLLEISDDNKKVIVQYSTKEGGAKIRMRHFNGIVFFCQSDYNSYIGMSHQTIEEVKNVFFHEALVGFLKKLRDLLPRQAETLREGVLLEL